MAIAILYPLITVAWWYLGAAADITYPLRRRLPNFLQRYLSCAACSGFLYGAAIAAIGEGLGAHVDGLAAYVMIPAVAFASIMWTPLGAYLLVRSLRGIHETLHDESDRPWQLE